MESIQPFAELIDPVRFAAARDPEGRKWIAQLPALVERMSQQWRLERDHGPIRHGYGAIVLPVRRRSERFVLKLTWPAEGTADEARGLEAWDGKGVVRMVAADIQVGALLLERLDADRTLRDVETMEAARVAGGLLCRLAIPAPPGFRDVRALVAQTARSLRAQQARPDCPVPRDWLEAAFQLAQYLATRAGTDLLVHADLHYDNILAGTREPWLAVDPRPVAGEPEQAVPELLWTRHDVEGEKEIRRLFSTLVESAGLDTDRARQWVIVRCVDYWLWGLDHGLTLDPRRCRHILQALTGHDDCDSI